MYVACTLKKIVLNLLILGISLVSIVFAATEMNLYNESMIVSRNATQKEQDQAIRQAFKQLLVRVSGVRQVLDNEQIIEALGKGAAYLATFRFESSDQLFTNVLGESVPTKKMILEFDKRSVDSLLVRNHLPVWSAKRPDILIVLADRLQSADHILADGEESDLAEAVKRYADQRGVPYQLPIMDLEDSLAFNFTSVYGLFSTDIDAGAERYQPDAILTGRLSDVGNDQVQADWMVLFKNERVRMPPVQGSIDDVVSQGIDFISTRLSEQYALLLDPQLLGALTIQVSDVASLKDFAALESYLKSINLITSVTLSQYSSEGAAFAIELSGDLTQLADVIALDDKLIPVQEATLEAQLDNVLRYQWQH
ncbi:MAG: DUF2066 domain-containing protein [Reinekea sp.]